MALKAQPLGLVRATGQYFHGAYASGGKEQAGTVFKMASVCTVTSYPQGQFLREEMSEALSDG